MVQGKYTKIKICSSHGWLLVLMRIMRKRNLLRVLERSGYEWRNERVQMSLPPKEEFHCCKRERFYRQSAHHRTFESEAHHRKKEKK